MVDGRLSALRSPSGELVVLWDDGFYEHIWTTYLKGATSPPPLSHFAGCSWSSTHTFVRRRREVLRLANVATEILAGTIVGVYANLFEFRFNILFTLLSPMTYVHTKGKVPCLRPFFVFEFFQITPRRNLKKIKITVWKSDNLTMYGNCFYYFYLLFFIIYYYYYLLFIYYYFY